MYEIDFGLNSHYKFVNVTGIFIRMAWKYIIDFQQ